MNPCSFQFFRSDIFRTADKHPPSPLVHAKATASGMGNCGTKAKPQLSKEELQMSQCLDKIKPGYGERFATILVAEGIESDQVCVCPQCALECSSH